MIDHTECPVCESGSLTAEQFDDEISYNGRTIKVAGLERCRCSACGADPVLTEQIRRNQVRYADARRASDGLMPSCEIYASRTRFGLTQGEAALLFGGGTNGFSKYERGEVIQSTSMDRLLRVVAAYPMLLDLLRIYAGLTPQTRSANEYEAVSETTMPMRAARTTRLRIVGASSLERPDNTRGAVAA